MAKSLSKTDRQNLRLASIELRKLANVVRDMPNEVGRIALIIDAINRADDKLRDVLDRHEDEE